MIPLHPPLSLPLLLPPSLSLFSPQERSWCPPWAVWILLPLRQLPHHLWVQTVWKKVSTAEIFSSCVLLATFLLPLSFPPSPSSLFLPLFSSILQVLSLAHDQAWSVLSHGRTQKGTALPDQLHQKGGCGLRWRYLHVCSQMSAQNDTRGMMVCFPLSDPWLIITSSLSSSSPSLPSFFLLLFTLFQGATLHFRASDHPGLPDTMTRRPLISFRITHVPERAKRNLL